MDFFVVTDLVEFAAQPELQEFLTANFPVFDEGPTFLIFDLRKGN
jgi:hypothetical protein